MPHTNPLISDSLQLPLKVWVLAPYISTNDENLDYYYDFSQSIEEYSRAFDELGLDWKWQPVTMDNFRSIIKDIVTEKISGLVFPVVLNLCDGDEVNGTPGISVLKLLHESKLAYTGSKEFFYEVTTSKIVMKSAFDKAAVCTPAWEAITSENQDISGIFDRLGTPVIVKPSVSGGSMGVGIKNVVYNEAEIKALIKKMFDGYRGWNLVTDGLIAESFIAGAEYTCFITGEFDDSNNAHIYEPVERIFHKDLPENEKFLSFDRLWEIYEEETAMPDNDNFYEYSAVDSALTSAIKKISWDAYVALRGSGYTRIDIRMDRSTGKLLVLEANAQCGISEDENFTSIGAILKVSGISFPQLVKEIINLALRRYNREADLSVKLKQLAK